MLKSSESDVPTYYRDCNSMEKWNCTMVASTLYSSKNLEFGNAWNAVEV